MRQHSVLQQDVLKRKLYLCTPLLNNMETFVENCIKGGVGIVQLRDKSLTDSELIDASFKIKPICAKFGALFIVNDRPDIAHFVDADGVHVGQDDISPMTCRKILGASKIIGMSTHSVADFQSAKVQPVDYLSAGPVVPTPTKLNRPGTGLDYIKHVSENSDLPWFLTGDVNLNTVKTYISAGARQFVVVRYLVESKDSYESARKLMALINQNIT